MDQGIVQDGAERLRAALLSEVTACYAARLATAGPRRKHWIEKVLRRKVEREWKKLRISGHTLW
ncbi:MAG: hypothetical protein KF708_23450 [Pirellulales bacterium]|nr:hypothetical protein [Pirellulales bacterium]